MKKLRYLLLLFIALLSNFSQKATAQSGLPCGVTSPMDELPFLDSLAYQLCDPFSCVQTISQAWYNGQYVFFTTPNMFCADFPAEVYTCNGNLLCSMGGFGGGFGDCPNFFETITNVYVIASAETYCIEQGPCYDPALVNSSSCFDEYSPVCGCNGISYSNACSAANSGIASSIPGICGTVPDCINPAQINPMAICPLIYAPVCGCDGITYDNACVAQNMGVTTFVPGVCGEPSVFPPCTDPDAVNTNPCPVNYEPVCGCNGITYVNSCYASRAGVLSYTTGKCLLTTFEVCIDNAVEIGVQFEPNTIYIWSPATGLSCDNCPDPMASPEVNTLYTLTTLSTVGGGQTVQHFYVYISNCYPIYTYTICEGNSITLGNTFIPNTLYSWIPATGLSCSNCPNPIASPSEHTVYTLTMTSTFGGEPAYEIYEVFVSNCSADTSYYNLCAGDTLQLVPEYSDVPETTFSWSPATALDCTNCPTPYAWPEDTTLYTFTQTDWNSGEVTTSYHMVYVSNCDTTNYVPLPKVKQGLKLYPNPLQTGELYLKLPVQNVSNATIQLYDLLGRQIYITHTANQSGVFNVKVGELATGLYFVHIQTAQGTYSASFMKE